MMNIIIDDEHHHRCVRLLRQCINPGKLSESPINVSRTQIGGALKLQTPHSSRGKLNSKSALDSTEEPGGILRIAEASGCLILCNKALPGAQLREPTPRRFDEAHGR